MSCASPADQSAAAAPAAASDNGCSKPAVEPPAPAPPAVLVSAEHAHSEFWLPALQCCAKQLGWAVDVDGSLAQALAPQMEPAFVYLPPQVN